MQFEEMNDLNENKMSLDNMPVIMVPKPLPLVRKMCYSDRPNCLCSFCEHEWYKSINIAIKELPQISLEPEPEEILLENEEIILEPVLRGLQFPIPLLIRSTNDPSTWDDADDEEILFVGIV